MSVTTARSAIAHADRAAAHRGDVDPLVMVVAAPSDWTDAAERATRDGVAVLPVSAVGDRLLVGPLTVPNRVGCAHCARRRMEANGRLPGDNDAGLAASCDLEAVLARLRDHIGEDSLPRLLDHVADIGPDGVVSLHRVVPLPWCAVCGGAATLDDRRPPASAHDDGPFAGWLDPLTGVIPALLPDPPDTAVPFPYVLTAAPPHVVGDDGRRRRLDAGWGKGDTLVGAVLSAVGEAIERYAPSIPDPRRIVWARPDELEGERFDIDDFALYSSGQYARPGFPYVAPDPTVAHPWVRGRLLATDTAVWIPAVLVYLSLTIGPENHVCQGTSNGLAASLDHDDAARRAVLELVERDAFMTAWLTATPGRRLVVDRDVDPAVDRVRAVLHGLGARVETYVLPTSLIGTTVLAAAFGDGREWPGATIGVATSLDPHIALRSAVLELGQTGPYLRGLLHREGCRVRGPHDVVDLVDHARYWFDADRTADLAERLCGDAEPPVTLSSLVALSPTDPDSQYGRSLAAAGVRVAVVDVTSPDVATGDFRVVRAVSPDLQPISYGHGLERLPVARLKGRVTDAVPAVHPLW